MSSPIDRPFPPGDPAPFFVNRDSVLAVEEQADRAPRPRAGEAPWIAEESPALAPDERKSLERIVAMQKGMRRKLDPPIPPPPAAVRSSSAFVLFCRLAIVALIGAVAALAAVGEFPKPDSWSGLASVLGARPVLLESASPGPALAPDFEKTRSPAGPRLVAEGASAENGDAVALGVRVEGSSDGVTAVISGLRRGTTLSSGRPWGETGWIVPAAELAITSIRPPYGFSGTMEYVITLRRPDNSIVDQQAMRLDWSQIQSAGGERTARELDREEIAVLLKRGQELFETGDLAGARLLLQRAAEAGNARAAYALGASYDPLVLQELRVYGVMADVAKARAWYEKAKAFGSTEAPRRLELLVSQSR